MSHRADIFSRARQAAASLLVEAPSAAAIASAMKFIDDDPDFAQLVWKMIRTAINSERFFPQLKESGIVRAATSKPRTRFDALWYISKARVPHPAAAAGALLDALPADQAWCAALFSHDPSPSIDVLAPLSRVLAEASAQPIASWFYSEFVRSAGEFAEHMQIDSARAILNRATRSLLLPGQARDGHAAYALNDGLTRELARLSRAGSNWLLSDSCEWLNLAIDGETWARGPDDDASTVWRPTIENHEQNLDAGAASLLVGIVREAARAAIESRQLTVAQACEVLRSHKRQIFTRLCLHLVNSEVGRQTGIAGRLLMDRDLLEQYPFRHEYAQLVASSFGSLNTAEQAEWFTWIKDGRRDLKAISKRKPADAERSNRWWQLSALSWAKQFLQGEALALYEGLRTELGEPPQDEFRFKVTAFERTPSPLSEEQLAKLPFPSVVKEVVACLKAKASDRFFDPEMLTRAFSSRVQSNLGESIGSADFLLSVEDARVVRSYIDGVSSKLGSESQPLSFAPLLGLCQSILRQPLPLVAEEEGKAKQDELEKSWLRNSVIRLVDTAVRSSNAALTASMSPHLDDIIQMIAGEARAQSPSKHILAGAEKPGAWRRDWYQEAINCGRGRAMDTLLECVRLSANQRKESEGDTARLPGGWDQLGGSREAIEWHLEPGNSSVEALTVLGVRLGLLYWIDDAWVSRRLMPQGAPLPRPTDAAPLDTARGWAMWNAFVTWSKPHPLFLQALRGWYAKSSPLVAEGGAESKSDSDRPAARLLQHLAIYYCWGDLPLAGDGLSMENAFASATPELRRQTIAFLGTCFEDGPLPDELSARMMALWDAYWTLWSGKADAKQNRRGWSFGQWFAKGQCPTGWLFSRLADYIAEVGLPEPDDLVLLKLNELASADFERAMNLYHAILLAGRDHRDFHADYSYKHMKDAVAAALRAGGAPQLAAERVLEELGRRGVLEAELAWDVQ